MQTSAEVPKVWGDVFDRGEPRNSLIQEEFLHGNEGQALGRG